MPWQGLVFLLLMVGIPIVVAWRLGGPPKDQQAAKEAIKEQRRGGDERTSETPAS